MYFRNTLYLFCIAPYANYAYVASSDPSTAAAYAAAYASAYAAGGYGYTTTADTTQQAAAQPPAPPPPQ